MRPLPGAAARALRPGTRPPRRPAGRSLASLPAWAPPLSLLLHGAVLAALLGLLTPEAVHEPVRMTGIPLVWVGEGEGSTARRPAELPPPLAAAPPEAPETPPVPPAPDAAQKGCYQADWQAQSVPLVNKRSGPEALEKYETPQASKGRGCPGFEMRFSVGAGVLAMGFRTPRLFGKYASSLTTIASKPAPTEAEIA